MILKVNDPFISGVDIDFVKLVFELIEKNDWRKIKKEAKEVKNEFCKRNSLDENFVSIFL